MKKLSLLAFFMFSMIAAAQDSKIEGKTSEKKASSKNYFNSDKKLGFTAQDSLFQVNIGVRVQSRAGYQKTDGQAGAVEGEIRRMRLKFDGFVYNPKFGYKIELGFSAGDLGVIKAGENQNVILDGVLFYKPTKNWSIGFGQTKLPGNNQRVISSGALEFTDRTINNSKFNIDRDFGLFIDYGKENPNHFTYAVKGALTKGEGRNWTKTKDDGISLTGKLELFPLGSFTKNGSHFEADLAREKTPKLLISGAFNQNNNARRSQGQLGNDLFEARTLQSFFFDTMLKYNGWAASANYMSRRADNPITRNPLDNTKTQAVFVGEGVDTQLSYLFPSKYQIAGRYSTQNVGKEIHAFTPDAEEFAVSFSKYFLEHKVKLQTECSYENLNHFSGNTTGSWYVRFQFEIGI
ncbi:porin [Flavobacterium acetivorans]|uniref:porin n=1 Tax=Flavobacterium acetivorans TaxID=2893883 RepID=UPI001E58995F|nr:porin [Flavobacterium sp. F-29]UFH36515.1 OprO/OprP family phosphate-selective porin [Flavobacterium sp. F-29]